MIPVFDFLRALAMLFVVYFHTITYHQGAVPFLGPIANSISPLSYDQARLFSLLPFFNLGEIGVALFFLISGFLILKSRESKTAVIFLEKRLIRIFPITVVGTIVVYLAIILVNQYAGGVSCGFNKSDLPLIITNALLINDLIPYQSSGSLFQTSIIMPHFWFLAVIVKYYILMAIIQRYGQKLLLFYGLILLLMSCLYIVFKGSFISHYLAVLAFSSHHILYILIGSSLYYLVGEHVLKSTAFHCSKQIGYVLLLIAMFILSFYVLREDKTFPIPSDMMKNYFLSLFIFIFALLLSPKIKLCPKIIKFFADISFSAYVLHYSLGAVLIYLLLRIGMLNDHVFIMYLVVFALIFLFSFILYHFIEQPFAKIQIYRKSK